MPDVQLEAERSHVLINIVSELGGLAHQDMTTTELDTIVDNMLSKGFQPDISQDLMRWIHTHRSLPGLKIAQILGAHVTKTSSIIPECFGKFHDPTAVECKACLDRTACKMKSGARAANEAVGPVTQLYPVGKIASAQTIAAVLQGKNGQISKHLSHGDKVVLIVSANRLKVLSVSSPNPEAQTLKEGIDMAQTKGTPAKPVAKAKPVVEEEEVELDLSALGVEDEAEEVEADVTEEVEEVEEAAAPAPKAKKEKVAKPKPVLNKAQQDFQNELDKRTGEDKQKYSKAVATKLKLAVEEKGDARIDHMLRTMAIKKRLATPAAKK